MFDRRTVLILVILGLGGCLLLMLLLPLSEIQTRRRPVPVGFVGVRGHELVDQEKPFRFISFNVPCLHYNEDHLPFDVTNPWRLPNEFEIRDALETVRQAGGTVVRIYPLSVRQAHGDEEIPRHIIGPGQLDEKAFRALDLVLKIANETGVRVIIPFIDNWQWWGGVEAFAAFRGKPKDAFWSDPQVVADFKETLGKIIERENAYTGRRYRDDGAILAWETGNELESPEAWTAEIAAHIKSLDPQHLLIDGYHAPTVRAFSLRNPHIDIVTTHHYPDPEKVVAHDPLVAANWEQCKGKKPYIVGEVGLLDTVSMRTLLKTVVDSEIAGALVWSLRQRNRDGGFYWHTEPSGGDRYKAYHWPGFPSGDAYEETALLEVIHARAFAIRGLPVPRAKAPAAPRLLPILHHAHISWQGSVGATHYRVERSNERDGKWQTIASHLSEDAAPYRPLFADTSITKGTVFYRVIAQNVAGDSPPSNVVGPVYVNGGVLVDEMRDLSKIHRLDGKGLSLRTDLARRAKEDPHRLRGVAGDEVVYVVGGAITSCVVDAFFPGEAADFEFALSADGMTYEIVESSREDYENGAGDYDYWRPSRFRVDLPVESSNVFLAIRFGAEAQIAHIEIRWTP